MLRLSSPNHVDRYNGDTACFLAPFDPVRTYTCCIEACMWYAWYLVTVIAIHSVVAVHSRSRGRACGVLCTLCNCVRVWLLFVCGSSSSSIRSNTASPTISSALLSSKWQTSLLDGLSVQQHGSDTVSSICFSTILASDTCERCTSVKINYSHVKKPRGTHALPTHASRRVPNASEPT